MSSIANMIWWPSMLRETCVSKHDRSHDSRVRRSWLCGGGAIGALLIAVAAIASTAVADDGGADVSVAQSALAQMPVKEVTVFKDGHAFVLHQGTLPTDESGNVVLDYLPTPVLGTFWPYSADKRVELTSVTAGVRAVTMERTALDTRAMLEANVGARVIVKENGVTYHARIAGIPERSPAELAATSPPNTPPQLPQKGSLILLETDEGTRAVPIDRIQEVTFRDVPKSTGRNDEFRNLLTLRFAWPDGKANRSVDVGMAYLQRGIRWIPNYRISIDGEGKAQVELQATLLNELTDLNDVTAHLVIGVPTFYFKETADPISLQQAVAQLSQYFQEGSQQAQMLSNAIMTQAARMGEYRTVHAVPQAGGSLGPDVGEGGANEDLFVFAVEHLTLKKGERMVLPVVSYVLPYTDIYTLDLPYGPPPEVRQQFNKQQQAELARLLTAPKAMHKLRLANKSQYPLTTGPALIVKGDRVLAQALMTYTARGATTDLALTAAVDIQVRKTDAEIERIPNAANFNGHNVARANMQGKICLVNFHGGPVEIEVTRYVLGQMDKADHEGTAEQANVQEDGWVESGGDPFWWGWYNWPWWWHHFNGRGRATWKVNLDAGATVDLGYEWHYFWQ